VSEPGVEVLGGIEVTAIYGAQSKRGLVRIRVSQAEQLMPPAKAREIATFLLEAAGAAEGDEALMLVLDRAGASPAKAGQMLMALRTARAAIDRQARQEARRAQAEDQSDPDAPD
jgi:hypothetical protein